MELTCMNSLLLTTILFILKVNEIKSRGVGRLYKPVLGI